VANHTDPSAGYSPEVGFEVALNRLAPALWKLIQGRDRYVCRDFTVLYRGPRDWLGKVKALDTEGGQPVILFAGGTSWANAVSKLGRGVADGRWKPDVYPGRQWAR
jgi:hypothetical protein